MKKRTDDEMQVLILKAGIYDILVQVEQRQAEIKELQKQQMILQQKLKKIDE